MYEALQTGLLHGPTADAFHLRCSKCTLRKPHPVKWRGILFSFPPGTIGLLMHVFGIVGKDIFSGCHICYL